MKDWKLRKPVEELLLRSNARIFYFVLLFPSTVPLPLQFVSRRGLVPLYRSYSSSGSGSGRHTSSDSSSSSQEHPVHEMSLFLSLVPTRHFT